MSENTEEFVAWACDRGRTLEERYGVVRLIEATRHYWQRKHGIVEPTDIHAEIERQKRRGLDPTYKPKYTRAEAGRVAEVIPEVLHLSFHGTNDRPLRDISFLRFFPQVRNLSLSQTEIADLSPLAFLQSLTHLSLMDEVATRIGIIGELGTLERLSLYLRTPWPDLAGLERLTRLNHLTYSGNLVVLRDLPELPAVREASISHGRFNLPMRRVADMPAMPELRRLKLDNTASLDGIARYPQLLNLEIYGYFTDIRPLADLQELTHLFLSGGEYPDTVPISRMGGLCRVTIRHELPPDLTPLADLPRLHEIRLELAAVVPAELDSLNSLCVPWGEEFAAVPPRPLDPLRLRLRKKGEDAEPSKNDTKAPPREWADDHEMSKSESLWFIHRVNRRLTRLLGKGWGKIPDRFPRGAGNLHVTITRHEDIDRLPAIVRVLRELIVQARHPWDFLFIVNSLAQYERDMDEIRGEDDEFDAEREREEWEDSRRRRNERRDYLKRKYQLRLSEELGVPMPEPVPPASGETEDEPWQSTAEDDQPEYDLGTSLELYATVTETSMIIHDQDRELTEMLMEMKTEED